MLLGLLALVLLALLALVLLALLALVLLALLALVLQVQVVLASLAVLAQAGVGGLVACFFPPNFTCPNAESVELLPLILRWSMNDWNLSVPLIADLVPCT